MTSQRVPRSVVRHRAVAPLVPLALLLIAAVPPSPSLPAADGAVPSTNAPGLTGLAEARVIFGADTVVAEIARTPDERAQGLMYRDELAPDAGMLFVFPDASVRGFWMQNTYIPLDIAFLDPSFRVVDIQQMEPMTTNQHTARAPFMYALEVNQGWFAAHGVVVGSVAEILIGP